MKEVRRNGTKKRLTRTERQHNWISSSTPGQPNAEYWTQRIEKQRISFHLAEKENERKRRALSSLASFGLFRALWCVLLASRHSIRTNLILWSNEIHPVLRFSCGARIFVRWRCGVLMNLPVPTLRYNIAQCRSFFWFSPPSLLVEYCT